MTTERDIRATVSVDAEGDVSAPQQVAEGLTAMDAAAGAAAPNLDAAATSSDRLAESADKAQEKVGDLADSLDEVGQSDGGEGLENAAEGADQIGSKFDKAGDQVKAFEKLVKEGGEGVEEAAAKARLGINRLERETDQLKASGRGLTDEHTRELKELKAAYDQAIQGAGELKAAQREAARDVEQAASKYGELSGSIGGLDDIIGSVNPKLARQVVQLGAVAGAFKVGVDIGNSFRGALSAIDSELNTNFLPSLDKAVKAAPGFGLLEDAINRLVGPINDSTEALQRQADVLAELERLNLSTAGSIDEQAQRLEDYRRVAAEAGREQDAFATNTRRWAAELGLSKEALEKEVGVLLRRAEILRDQPDISDQALAKVLLPQLDELESRLGEIPEKHREAFEKAREEAIKNNPFGGLAEQADLSLEEIEQSADDFVTAFTGLFDKVPNLDDRLVSPKLKGQLQELLDLFASVGAEVPAHLAAVANQIGVVDSTTEKALERQRQLTERLRQEINQTIGGVASDIGEQVKAIETVLGELDYETLIQLDPASADKLVEWVEEHVEILRQSGGTLSKASADALAAIGVLTPAFGPVDEAARKAGGGIIKFGDDVTELGSKADKAGGTMKKGADAASEGASTMKDAAAEGGKAANQLGDQAAKGANASAEGAQKSKTAAEGARDAAAAASEAAEARLEGVSELLQDVEEGIKNIVRNKFQLPKLEGDAQLKEQLSAVLEVATQLSSALDGIFNPFIEQLKEVRSQLSGATKEFDNFIATTNGQGGGS